MLEAYAEIAGFTNVEFRKGEIEALPVEDDSVDDVATSNCVLNLVPDKDRAFREILRALKPGGRLAVSDMAWEVEPEPTVRADLEAIVGCTLWALVVDDLAWLTRLKPSWFQIGPSRCKHAGAYWKMIEDPRALFLCRASSICSV